MQELKVRCLKDHLIMGADRLRDERNAFVNTKRFPSAVVAIAMVAFMVFAGFGFVAFSLLPTNLTIIAAGCASILLVTFVTKMFLKTRFPDTYYEKQLKFWNEMSSVWDTRHVLRGLQDPDCQALLKQMNMEQLEKALVTLGEKRFLLLTENHRSDEIEKLRLTLFLSKQSFTFVKERLQEYQSANVLEYVDLAILSRWMATRSGEAGFVELSPWIRGPLTLRCEAPALRDAPPLLLHSNAVRFLGKEKCEKTDTLSYHLLERLPLLPETLVQNRQEYDSLARFIQRMNNQPLPWNFDFWMADLEYALRLEEPQLVTMLYHDQHAFVPKLKNDQLSAVLKLFVKYKRQCAERKQYEHLMDKRLGLLSHKKRRLRPSNLIQFIQEHGLEHIFLKRLKNSMRLSKNPEDYLPALCLLASAAVVQKRLDTFRVALSQPAALNKILKRFNGSNLTEQQQKVRAFCLEMLAKRSSGELSQVMGLRRYLAEKKIWQESDRLEDFVPKELVEYFNSPEKQTFIETYGEGVLERFIQRVQGSIPEWSLHSWLQDFHFANLFSFKQMLDRLFCELEEVPLTRAEENIAVEAMLAKCPSAPYLAKHRTSLRDQFINWDLYPTFIR